MQWRPPGCVPGPKVNDYRERTAGRRLLGCLVKGPLGCLAFVLGAAFMLVLFLPPVLGRLAKNHLCEWFGMAFEGSLEIGEGWLGSVYGPQRVEGLVLRDPEGREVLNATLSAPPLPVLDETLEGWGPVHLEVHRLGIVERPDGRTNLQHAFEPRSGDHRIFRFQPSETEVDFSFEEDRFDLRMPAALRFVVDVETLLWTDATGRELVFENPRFEAELMERGGESVLEVRGSGTLEGGEFDLDFTLPALRTLGDPLLVTRWKLDCEGRGLPAAAVEVLLGVEGWVERVLAPELASVKLELDREERGGLRVADLELSADGVDVRLAANLLPGEDLLQGRADDVVVVSLAPDSRHVGRLVPALVPLFEGFTPKTPVELTLTAFRAGLREDLATVRANLGLRSGPAAWSLDPGLRGLVGLQDAAAERELAGLDLAATLWEGRVNYDDQLVTVGSGSVLLGGQYDVVARRYKAFYWEHGGIDTFMEWKGKTMWGEGEGDGQRMSFSAERSASPVNNSEKSPYTSRIEIELSSNSS